MPIRLEPPAYTIGTNERGARYIQCGRCAMRSFNPSDIRELYCGFCRAFHTMKELSVDERVELVLLAFGGLER